MLEGMCLDYNNNFKLFKDNFFDKLNNCKKYFNQKSDSYVLSTAFSIDIETTTIREEEKDIAFPYIYMLGIDCFCYYTRYKDNFVEAIDFINNAIDEYSKKQSKKYRILCLIHNLNYEWTFFNGYFSHYGENLKVFATDNNNALTIYMKNIQFLDSLRLTNMTLEKVAKNYKLKHKKMVGDLDYNVYRDSETKLTDKELTYAFNDVIILNEYFSEEYLKRCLNAKNCIKIELTATGFVRTQIDRTLYRLNPNGRKLISDNVKELNDTSYNPKIGQMLYTAYTGAIVKSNAALTGKEYTNVGMFDETSAYPGVMLQYKYPMRRFKECNDDLLTILKNMYDYGYLVKCNILIRKPKFGFSIISASKCIIHSEVPYTYDNGRIYKGLIQIDCTEIDLYNILNYYDCEIEILEAYRSRKEYLPKYLLETVKYFYKTKSELKADPNKDESFYLYIKGLLNALYGACVEKPHDIQYTYNPLTGEYMESKNDKIRKGYLALQWGLWITAYGRLRLLELIKDLSIYGKKTFNEEIVIYCDTDSCKVRNFNADMLKIIESHNLLITNNIKKCCEFYNFDYNDFKDLGTWDDEGIATRFITRGSKKYLFTAKNKKGEYETTLKISGISQKAFKGYVEDMNYDLYEVFADKTKEFIIPSDYTNKYACKYISEKDFIQYNCNCNPTKGYVILSPVDFTFNKQTTEAQAYRELINSVSETYIVGGLR